MKTEVKLGRLNLKNPVTVASGTAAYGEELSQYYDISRLGAVFTKGLSLKPRPGNKGPRIMETPSGMLNSIGLENVGLDAFLKEKLPFLLSKNATVIPNVAGHSIEENVEVCRVLSATKGIVALELNVSCPNVKEGGIAFTEDIKVFSSLIDDVLKVINIPLIVKLSPNVKKVSDYAKRVKECGGDAVSAVNTFLGMKIDIENKRPLFLNKTAGLSGPAIRPMAVRIVYEIFSEVDIPIIGIGGIDTPEDVLEFLMAGASAVSIGTMNMVDPMKAVDCLDTLEDYLKDYTVGGIYDIIGCAHKE